MLKKLALLSVTCIFLQSCQPLGFMQDNPRKTSVPEVAFQQPTIKLPNSIIVCRNKQCAPAKLSMSKEYIYNTLLHMFDSNARKKALVCTADPHTHSCTEEYVSMPITVGITPAYLYIDDVKITDVSISRRNTSALNLILNWNISYNGQTPVCRPSKTLLYTKNVNNVIMEDNGYSCKMTTVGTSVIKTLFAVDYIDLDYGFIGGFYSIGISGPAFGGGSGYMILRLPEDISVSPKDFKATMKKFSDDEDVNEEENSDDSKNTKEDKKADTATQSNENKASASTYKSPIPVQQPVKQQAVQQPMMQQPVIQQPMMQQPVMQQPMKYAKQPTQPIQQPVKKIVKKRKAAPNVDTIIKYNHPAQAYENAKTEVLKVREKRRKAMLEKKKREAMAMDYEGIKVFPVKGTTKKKSTPVDKNSLTDYKPYD